ncbi:MAG: thymidylate synthase [Gammaproteobacteria bacterium]
MRQYLSLLEKILLEGSEREERTGVGTLSIFGAQLRFDLELGFPAVTTKKLAWKGVVSELLWFLEGSDDERRLAEIRFGKDRSELSDLTKYKTIWTDNADHQGKALGYENNQHRKLLGPIYGVQWRSWDNLDQLDELIRNIKNNPMSRRHILSAWNVGEIHKMALPPCHVMSQFYVDNQQRLSCHMYQRSADMFLGVPFNIASYALLTHVIAEICGLRVGHFVHSFGDAHIYLNCLEQVKEQLNRKPLPLPNLQMPKIGSLEELKKLSVDDFILQNYAPHEALSAPMAI